MVSWEFGTAGRVIFGPGVVRSTGRAARTLGERAFVVTGRSPARATALLASLSDAGISHMTFAVAGEPTISLAREAVRAARAAGCDLVVGFGGGSALDLGKAVAALLTNGGDPLDYLEVIGGEKPFRVPSAPYVAVPTTAGTGSEVTRNAVLLSPEHRVKASMRGNVLFPRLAVVDPELTRSLPPHLTAWTGMDALTQLIEPYLSPRANPMSDAVCRTGISRVARSLRRAYEAPDDDAARYDMSVASLFSGMALANAGLGAVHGLAAVIGGLCQAPHGAVCARLLAPVLEANARALREQDPRHAALARLTDVARLLTGRQDASALDGIGWIDELCQALSIPSLARWGLNAAAFPAVVAQAQQASSMKGNPVRLSDSALTEVLRQAL